MFRALSDLNIIGLLRTYKFYEMQDVTLWLANWQDSCRLESVCGFD